MPEPSFFGPDEGHLIEYYRLFNEEILRNFNKLYDNKEFSESQDHVLNLLKEFCTLCRTWWMKGKVNEEFPSDLSHLGFLLLHNIEGNAEKDTITTISNSRGHFVINTKVMCTWGNMSRALSTGSSKAMSNALQDVYHRFRKPRNIDPETRTELQEWTKNYFAPLLKLKDNKSEIQKELVPTASQNVGFQLKAGACIERPRREGGVLGLFADIYKCEPHPLQMDKTLEDRIDYEAAWVWKTSRQLLSEQLHHSRDCLGVGCTNMKLHLPLMPIGIKESGGRNRVPCLTSGIANTLCDHIRQKLFRIIKYDKRTAFRYGGPRKWFFEMIKSLKDDEAFHSSDLKSSTDFFSFSFARDCAMALHNQGIITYDEYECILLLTGSFRIGNPDDVGQASRVCIQVPPLEDIIEQLTIKGGYGAGTILKYAGQARKLLQSTWDKSDKKVVRAFPPESFPPPQVEVRRVLCNFIRRALTSPLHEEYLTQCGLHMSTSISIALLNMMNLFADDLANRISGYPARCVITGDDALRTGKPGNLEAYRSIIVKLQGVFSDTKDVTTLQPRVLFTEILSENGVFVNAPMPKIVVRPEPQLQEAPDWLTSISLLSAIVALPADKKVMMTMILEKYQHKWSSAKNLPILDMINIEHGIELRPLSVRCQSIINLKDPWDAVLLYHYYTQLIRVVPREERGIGVSSVRIIPKPTKVRYVPLGEEWKAGNLWLKLAVRKLQALTEVAQALERPKWAVGPETYSFEYLDLLQTTVNQDIDLITKDRDSVSRNPSQFKKQCMEVDVELNSIIPVHLLNTVP